MAGVCHTSLYTQARGVNLLSKFNTFTNFRRNHRTEFRRNFRRRASDGEESPTTNPADALTKTLSGEDPKFTPYLDL